MSAMQSICIAWMFVNFTCYVALCCYAMSAMQCMSVMTLHYMDVCELHILCYVHSIDDFLRLLFGSQSRLSRLVRLHRFCPQAGQVLIVRYYAALSSEPCRVAADLTFLLGPESDGADKCRLCLPLQCTTLPFAPASCCRTVYIMPRDHYNND